MASTLQPSREVKDLCHSLKKIYDTRGKSRGACGEVTGTIKSAVTELKKACTSVADYIYAAKACDRGQNQTAFLDLAIQKAQKSDTREDYELILDSIESRTYGWSKRRKVVLFDLCALPTFSKQDVFEILLRYQIIAPGIQ